MDFGLFYINTSNFIGGKNIFLLSETDQNTSKFIEFLDTFLLYVLFLFWPFLCILPMYQLWAPLRFLNIIILIEKIKKERGKKTFPRKSITMIAHFPSFFPLNSEKLLDHQVSNLAIVKHKARKHKHFIQGGVPMLYPCYTGVILAISFYNFSEIARVALLYQFLCLCFLDIKRTRN